MRKTHKKQLSLAEQTPDHPKAKELEKISEILDQNHSIYDLAMQDLQTSNCNKGANGMSAEQVIRAAIIKRIEECSYRELAFHLADSRAYGHFCRFGIGRVFKKSTLQGNIKALSADTWEEINRQLLLYSKEKGIESGRKVRVDCTVVESNIHAPYDSELLWDANRVIARILNRAKAELDGIVFSFMDHTRRAKRRRMEILNAKNKEARLQPYKDLIKISLNTIGYGENAIKSLQGYNAGDFLQHAVAFEFVKELKHYLSLARQVVCQTIRRVIDGETVHASEKIVSIFEPHTDIIRKDRRDTYYGHKICVTGGASNMILDCLILEGNPADTALTTGMLDRQNDIYGRYPLKAAFDGGFASHDNLKGAKVLGVKDVCFAKKRGLKEEEMCRSNFVYKGLRKFRAGIEAGISWLKRSFGMDRCTWEGFSGFKSYVWSGIVSANLLTMARQLLAD